MTYDVNIQVEIETDFQVSEQRLRDAVEWVLRNHQIEDEAGLSIVIMGDDEIRHLNQQFRSVDAPTDVLSFPAEPEMIPEDEEIEDEGLYLGDLLLALPYIQRQAESEQHSVSDELVLAVIHGTLHLLGYDHDTAENQSKMWAVQSEALKTMNVDIIVPLFEFDDDEE
jgi:probable rRNA maturation factor